MSRDDLVSINERIVTEVTGGHRAAPRRDPDRRLEPARCDVPRREERLGFPKERVIGQAGHPRHRAVPDVHRLGDRAPR